MFLMAASGGRPKMVVGNLRPGRYRNLSHLEPVDCPLPNLQIFLACVISGIDLIFHSCYRSRF